MSKDKHGPSHEELIRKIAGEIDLHYPLVMVASEAILNIVLKAVAGVLYEKAMDGSDWEGAPQSYHEGYLVGTQNAAATILALTSEGVKE